MPTGFFISTDIVSTEESLKNLGIHLGIYLDLNHAVIFVNLLQTNESH